MVIWGAVIQMFIIFPKFDRFRLLNIVALFGEILQQALTHV